LNLNQFLWEKSKKYICPWNLKNHRLLGSLIAWNCTTIVRIYFTLLSVTSRVNNLRDFLLKFQLIFGFFQRWLSAEKEDMVLDCYFYPTSVTVYDYNRGMWLIFFIMKFFWTECFMRWISLTEYLWYNNFVRVFLSRN